MVGGLTLVLSQQSAAAGERGPVAWMGLLRAGVGVLLLVLAWRQWRARPREPGAATLPKWMDMVESLSTPKALGLGFALVAVNPKNLMLTVSGAMAIAASEATRSAHWVALGIFGLVATAGVASPVLVHWAAGERSAAVLAAMKNWIDLSSGQTRGHRAGESSGTAGQRGTVFRPALRRTQPSLPGQNQEGWRYSWRQGDEPGKRRITAASRVVSNIALVSNPWAKQLACAREHQRE